MAGCRAKKRKGKRVPKLKPRKKSEKIKVMQDGRELLVTKAQFLLAEHLGELGLKHRFEVQVLPPRRWRWDICIPEVRIAIELDGYFKGRHGAGWGSDNEKQNIGVMQGWRVLRFSNTEAMNGSAKEFIKSWL
jgi:very-short-patch-repair endonuclease